MYISWPARFADLSPSPLTFAALTPLVVIVGGEGAPAGLLVRGCQLRLDVAQGRGCRCRCLKNLVRQYLVDGDAMTCVENIVQMYIAMAD